MKRQSKLTSFANRCYQTLKQVPKGKVTTYEALAHAMGTKAVRAVGTALKKNPFVPKVPCHRVVRKNGEIGKYARGPKMKASMLSKEGVGVKGDKIPDLKRYLHKFGSRKSR